uniref:Tubulin--tyrosine ligase-like protein 5 n=1 Tax=Plectus sambesii TaxID=2011161 RepID=A0A914X7W6_9BILA
MPTSLTATSPMLPFRGDASDSNSIRVQSPDASSTSTLDLTTADAFQDREPTAKRNWPMEPEVGEAASQPEERVKTPELIRFTPDAFKHVVATSANRHKYTRVGAKKRLVFKLLKNESRLIKTIFHSYGFEQASPYSQHFNVLWTGTHLRSHCLRSLAPWQRVNHFPRSYELTRKDKLYENVARASALFGADFDIVPEFCVTPRDIDRFRRMCSTGGSRQPFIVKPVSSSRGRGIFLATRPEEIPLSSVLLISKYISDPYLINGHKFDIRLYVAVTSFNPLVVYLYDEGMTRFAAEKYVVHVKTYDQQHVHLTNYSLNKHSKQYVKNERADAENTGHKWTLSAMLRHMAEEGRDVEVLMMRIEDLIVKTLLSAQSSIAAACRSYVAYEANCFELFGFDILIDNSLKPWLLEVNLSPSLSCDSPLDLALKSRLICDVLTLAGVPIVNPRSGDTSLSPRSASRSAHPPTTSPVIGVRSTKQRRALLLKRQAINSLGRIASAKERTLDDVARDHWKRVEAEEDRCGRFIRIFPRKHTWLVYSPLMEDLGSENYDQRLYENLYGPESENARDATALLVRRQIMDVNTIVCQDEMDPKVQKLLKPVLIECVAYSQRKTVLGGNYPVALPRVRTSARKRTKSLLDLYANPRQADGTISRLVLTNPKELEAEFGPRPVTSALTQLAETETTQSVVRKARQLRLVSGLLVE